jgi:SAM-dependent methyltransferase
MAAMRFGIRPQNPIEWIALQTKKIPAPILDVIVGPLQARAWIAAERVGLFAALAEGAASAGELAARLKLDAECLALVLRVLRAMEYAELSGERWQLSELGERYFGKDAPESYRAFVAYGGPQWDLIERLEQVLRSGEGLDIHASHTPDEWSEYQRAMLENASAFAWFVVDNLPVPTGAKRCLDLAGAHGFVSAALCARHPGLSATVFDLPAALATARGLAQQRGYADKVAFREGDLVRDAYEPEQDVVLLCNILHHFPVETNRAILRKVHAALRPGGVVGIFDLETPELQARPEAAADAFALFFRVTSTSACFRGRDYESWLTECGFQAPRTIRSLKMPSRMLVVATR